jgi:actin-related protein 8
VSSTTVSLRERMRFYKLRVTQNATSIASTFNESFKPEVIPETTDPYNIDWITESNEDDVIIGEKVRNSTFILYLPLTLYRFYTLAILMK